MIPTDITFTCVDRFLKYVKYDTQSSETSETFPSTEKQKILGEELVRELLEMVFQNKWLFALCVLIGFTGALVYIEVCPKV